MSFRDNETLMRNLFQNGVELGIKIAQAELGKYKRYLSQRELLREYEGYGLTRSLLQTLENDGIVKRSPRHNCGTKIVYDRLELDVYYKAKSNMRFVAE